MAPSYRNLKRRAQWMRKNPTPAEKILWGKLRKRRLLGRKFRRQHILSPYIVDFYCFQLHLAIEVDGEIHSEKTSEERDDERDTVLREIHGVTVLRFTNYNVHFHLDDVLDEIKAYIQALSDSENPIPNTG